jgi:exopolysaccharide biosynthesis protein
MKEVYAIQHPVAVVKDSSAHFSLDDAKNVVKLSNTSPYDMKPWNKTMAVGGGPVLLQNGSVTITNDEELKFAGKQKYDLHPRTLIGYTQQNKMIVMVVEGRHPGVSEGASLVQCAQLMLSLGCVEAMNLDGGGSTSMLINGKATIYPSDKGIERPIPAVLMVY